MDFFLSFSNLVFAVNHGLNWDRIAHFECFHRAHMQALPVFAGDLHDVTVCEQITSPAERMQRLREEYAVEFRLEGRVGLDILLGQKAMFVGIWPPTVPDDTLAERVRDIVEGLHGLFATAVLVGRERAEPATWFRELVVEGLAVDDLVRRFANEYPQPHGAADFASCLAGQRRFTRDACFLV